MNELESIKLIYVQSFANYNVKFFKGFFFGTVVWNNTLFSRQSWNFKKSTVLTLYKANVTPDGNILSIQPSDSKAPPKVAPDSKVQPKVSRKKSCIVLAL